MQTQAVPTAASKSVTYCEAAVGAQSIGFSLHSPRSIARDGVETFIRDKYRATYAAELSVFLPLLLSMSSSEQSIAALGLKPGSCGEFFLEQYLTRPIEQEMAELMAQPVSRNAVVEVGNLVSERAGSSPILFLIMAASLEAAGYRWLAFTGTPQVKKLVERLNCEPIVLNEADPSRLAGGVDQWGRYYDTHPQVMALDLRNALAQASQRPLIAAMLEKHAPACAQLAQSLRDHRRVCGV